MGAKITEHGAKHRQSRCYHREPDD